VVVAGLTALDWYVLVRHELLLFAATFFLIGSIDELAVDGAYLWLRMTGRARTPLVDEAELAGRPLAGRCAVFVPAWQEHQVIAAMIDYALGAWDHDELRLYVGCYRGDTATLSEAMRGGAGDPRLRIVVHDAAGPTCKADCLNRLYQALQDDELREGAPARMVVLHDAEDMIDPAALSLLDAAIERWDFVQLPVLALPHPGSPLVSGHYTDEFCEAHGRSMVVRSALGQGLPGAGVGCAIARPWLARLDRARSGAGPFAVGALTEDYELGLQLAALGARSRFLRARTTQGRLIATRAFFPTTMASAVRQKTRWLHGIALQGWDRLGWPRSTAGLWMQLRDRRGPLAALLLALAYVLVVVSGVELALSSAGVMTPAPPSPTLQTLLWINLGALLWRLAARAVFTTREFGLAQGLLAIPRVIVSNTVAIVAARRALVAYCRSLRGAPPAWDKTEHADHPALRLRPALGGA
jgi:bacteriophage N4 adsorption protein B